LKRFNTTKIDSPNKIMQKIETSGEEELLKKLPKFWLLFKKKTEKFGGKYEN